MASVDIEAARAKLMAEMKVDVLTELQEADNEKARKGVSRSFICMSSKSLSIKVLMFLLADTITGLFS